MDGSVTASVAVEIDPRLTAHQMHGVQYWLIRGRVLAAEPVAHVLLLQEGREVARLEFGAEEARTERRLPDGRVCASFHLNLLRPAPAAHEPGAFALSAATRGGAAAGASFAFEVKGGGAQVVRGPVGPAGEAEEDRPPLMLMVERAARDAAGRVQLVGWAVSESKLLAVQALTGGTVLGRARIDLPRSDVAAARVAYPNAATAGFRLPLGADPPAEVTVQAITQSGACHRLLWRVDTVIEETPTAEPPPAAPPDPRREVHLHCDFAVLSAAGELWVEGWAVCAAGIARVVLELDGTEVGEAELGRPRTDVGAAFPAIPFARLAGFRFRGPVPERFAGRHELRLLARNGLDDAREERWTVVAGDMSAAPAEAVEAENEQEFEFRIDHPDVIDNAVPGPIAGRMTIAGWAVARSGLERIVVALDGAPLGEAHSGQVRADVHGAYPDWPDSLRSGYAFHCPPRLLTDGAHTVELRFVARNGRELVRRFAITVQKPEETSRLGIRRRLPQAEIDLAESVLAARQCRPRFRLLVPAGSGCEPEALTRTLRSLVRQAYPEWDATILVRGSRAETAARAAVEADPDLEGRARVLKGRQAAIDDADLAGVLA
ncbi:MAG: hypothetical protein ACREFY_06910, partial [Acetobacteraceae bacterium]